MFEKRLEALTTAFYANSEYSVTSANLSRDQIERETVLLRLLVKALEGKSDCLIGRLRDFDKNPVTLQKNRFKCEGYLRDGLEGDSIAREKYQQERLCNYFSSHYVVKEYLKLVCMDELSKIDIDKTSDNKDVRYNIAQLLVNSSNVLKEKDGPAHWGLSGPLTYAEATHALEILKYIDRSMQLSIWQEDVKTNDVWLFNPVDHTPFSQCAFEAWQRGFDLMLKGVIIDDVLKIHGVKIPNVAFLKLLEMDYAPWNILDQPPVKNIQALVEALKSDEIDHSYAIRLLSRHKSLFECTTEEFSQVIDRNKAKVERRKRQEASTQASAIKPEAEIENDPKSTRREFMDTVMSQMPTHDEAKARRLYSQYKKGEINLTEAIEIATGATAPNLRNVLTHSVLPRFRFKNRVKQDKNVKINKKPEKNATPDAENYTILGTDQKWYTDWFRAISKINQTAVSGRLKRAEKGEFLDYNQYSQDKRIFELRIKREGALRVYFAFVENDQILIVNTGNKNTDKDQKREFKKAAERLDEYLMNRQ